MPSIPDNVAALAAEIRRLEKHYGRTEGSVTLLAVTKKQGVDAIGAAYAAGLRHFGESYVQEAMSKIAKIAEIDEAAMPDIVWHFVGPLQSNKTRRVASRFHWVHSVDREKTARRLSEQRPPDMPPLNVCVQLRLSDEGNRAGAEPQDLESLCDLVAALPELRLRGLMGMPPPGRGLDQEPDREPGREPGREPDREIDTQRAAFRRLAGHFNRLQARFPAMDTLSMGMSGDYEAAIAEGATIIRLGTALFGPRMG